MKKIVYIADPEILAIPIVECHEVLIDLKTQDILQYGPPPECELTAFDYTKMRKSVFEKLCQAQQDLPQAWRFRLYEGFRSLRVQQQLFDAEYQRVTLRYPHDTHQQRFHETTRLVSPVTHLDSSKNIPPHNTGAAVDIEIVTRDGTLVDMGMAAKDWIHVNPELCASECYTISKQAQHHRRLLHDIMYAHGFVNYPTEWWHFSYGDRYWAYHVGMTHAIYDSAENFHS